MKTKGTLVMFTCFVYDVLEKFLLFKIGIWKIIYQIVFKYVNHEEASWVLKVNFKKLFSEKQKLNKLINFCEALFYSKCFDSSIYKNTRTTPHVIEYA